MPKTIRGLPIKEYHRQWRLRNIEKTREYKRQWRLRNIEKVKEYNRRAGRKYREKHRKEIGIRVKRWRKNNLEAYKKIRHKHATNRVKNLWDCYLKDLIADYGILKRGQITNEMMELKRQQMLLTRQLKKAKEI